MQVTVGLSLHRPEIIPWTAREVAGHEAVFLEEPPDPGFGDMLRGALAVEDYLATIDTEYPAFSRGMCRLLRSLHAAGTALHQVEPFLQILISIHEFFAAGHRPADIAADSIQHPVYLAERAATAALLAYYRATAVGTFEEAVRAVLRFARADAARFRLRDSLRAQALAPLVERYRSSYVEAGWIHARLPMELRRRLPGAFRVRTIFLPSRALTGSGEPGLRYSPGDRLTLLYLFRPDFHHSVKESLLAARAMIHAKILLKEESPEDPERLPHLRDEAYCTRLVERLSLDACRLLFQEIRRLPTAEARRRVEVAAGGAGPCLSAP